MPKERMVPYYSRLLIKYHYYGYNTNAIFVTKGLFNMCTESICVVREKYRDDSATN